ncbi:hypothetical protein BV22DRAFT_1050247 [Leucogyrophana mollusca]|uniref:Uncharacterized protein n=1 Tax=Leucogyrophana mollusca TaxID=85980 RepID=A0ACB8B5R1_9AGAM|nr:hypothetical protein BV22DRAFT_1050247 [Leucogyrophana mollusca]
MSHSLTTSSMLVPSESVLLVAVRSEINSKPDIGIARIVECLKIQNPLWCQVRKMKCIVVSEDVVLPVVGVVVCPDPVQTAQEPAQISKSFLAIRSDRPQSENAALDVISAVLEESHIAPARDFYPRQFSECNIYYQAYYTTYPEDNRAVNSIWAVVIVKNGSMVDPDDPVLDIDEKELARTIWWYWKSGNDVRGVTADRRMADCIGDMEL